MYNIIIFGTGQGANKVTKFIKEELEDKVNIVAYVDNHKKEEFFLGKRVLDAIDIYKYNYDYIIIGSIWFKEITDQLLGIGIDIKRIIPFFQGDYWVNTENEFSELLLRNKHKFSNIELGHFYSPIPSINEIKDNEIDIFNLNPKYIEGVNLNTDYQLSLFNNLTTYYKDLPFSQKPSKKVRYHFENKNFEYADAIILYSMLRHFSPNKIIEIGSGYSSSVTLDTNKLFLNNKIECTFIEPYPQLLNSVIGNEDTCKISILDKRVQDVNLEVFDTLSEGDILFVDSTHVSKVGSDVNYIMFNILPRLKSGVIIHFHDIFYPFEYPKQWVYNGIYWNEAYILRAFLQYNNEFEILFFNHYFNNIFKELVKHNMPLCLKNTGGSIWIRKK